MKKLNIYVVLFAIAILIGIIVVKHIQLEKANDSIQLQAVEISTLEKSVRTYKDKNGELISKVESVEIEKDNLKESLKIAGYNIKDLKAKNIKWRKLNSALKLEIESSNSGETALVDTFYITKIPTDTGVVNDTIKMSTFNWSNNYLTLLGNIKNKDFSFEYTYRTELDIFQEPRRKETIVTISLTDPYASVIAANSITVSHKKKWFEKPWLWGLGGLTAGLLIAK